MVVLSDNDIVEYIRKTMVDAPHFTLDGLVGRFILFATESLTREIAEWNTVKEFMRDERRFPREQINYLLDELGLTDISFQKVLYMYLGISEINEQKMASIAKEIKANKLFMESPGSIKITVKHTDKTRKYVDVITLSNANHDHYLKYLDGWKSVDSAASENGVTFEDMKTHYNSVMELGRDMDATLATVCCNLHRVLAMTDTNDIKTIYDIVNATAGWLGDDFKIIET